MDLETMKDQLEWGRENLENPLDNVSVREVQWLIKKVEKYEEALKNIDKKVEEKTHNEGLELKLQNL